MHGDALELAGRKADMSFANSNDRHMTNEMRNEMRTFVTRLSAAFHTLRFGCALDFGLEGD
jgi:hypothetical protein